MQKRAQVTVFIILGIIVIAVIGTVAFFYGEQIQNLVRPGVLDASSLEPLRSYIVSCMEDSVENDLKLLKRNSGYFNEISSTVSYSGNEVNALVDNGINKMNSETGIENEISENVENKVDKCDLSGFDFEIVKGEVDAETEIRESSIVVTMDYPLTISKGETSLTMNEFSLIVEDDFGKIYRAVNDVVNAVINGDFDHNEYNRQNRGVSVTFNDGVVYRIVTEREKDGFVFGVKNE